LQLPVGEPAAGAAAHRGDGADIRGAALFHDDARAARQLTGTPAEDRIERAAL
jgi:hypothetical protein